jgi:hypothetical protein
MSVTKSTITIQCDACLEDYEADKWDAKHGLTLCDSCNDGFANEASDDVFESALWSKVGRNEVR